IVYCNCDAREMFMSSAKPRTIPPLRVSEELRADAESVLAPGETLSAFVMDAVSRSIDFRKSQLDFKSNWDLRKSMLRETASITNADRVSPGASTLSASARSSSETRSGGMVRGLALDMNISRASQLQYTIPDSGIACKLRMTGEDDRLFRRNVTGDSPESAVKLVRNTHASFANAAAACSLAIVAFPRGNSPLLAECSHY